MSRWRKDASSNVDIDISGDVIKHEIEQSLAARYSELSSISQSIVAIAAKSVDVFHVATTQLPELQKKVNSFKSNNAECGSKPTKTETVSIKIDKSADDTCAKGSTLNITICNPMLRRKRGDPKAQNKNPAEKGGKKRTRKSRKLEVQVGKLCFKYL